MTQAQSQTRYLLSDGLGSIRQATDELGQVVATASYDPYGNPLGGQESGYGYTGEPWLAELGLLHLRARWYDPNTATFLSRDSVETEHPYAYVRGNPVNATDPSGKRFDPTSPCWGNLSKCVLDKWHQEAEDTWDKRNSFFDCDVNHNGKYDDDDGIQTTDGVYEVVRDFTCEYGPEYRYFGQNYHLTQLLKNSSSISRIRQEFYNNGATHLNMWNSFGVTGFIDASFDTPFDHLVAHMLGSYRAIVDRRGDDIQFVVINTMDRESATRIPARDGDKYITYDDYLENPVKYADTPLKSALKERYRSETIDPMGGGNMYMTIEWYEPLDICPVPAPTPPSIPTPTPTLDYLIK